jgi:DNA/RNA-binding domain of Phe-tRNA-synthetase-like protein
MKLCIDTAIFKRFPQYQRYVVVSSNINNIGDSSELAQKLRTIETTLRADPELVDFKNNPRLASWRQLFTDLGVNPNQCMPSIVALVKRVLSGSNLPIINPLVAIMNIVSLSHLLPCGGDDLDKVQGDLILGFAVGDETYIPLGKPEVREYPKPGEVIYYDSSSQDVLCRSWCWRNGDTTKILPSTTRAAINVDVIPPVSIDEGAAAAKEIASLVETKCGGQAQIYCLKEDNLSANITF